LAGGAGTRLWPISRALYPKQLLKLFGNKTLIQHTFSRLKKLVPPENIYIITNKSFKEDIFLQLKDFGLFADNIIVEPVQKSTAPAIALASKKILEKDKDAVVLVSPVDHFIKKSSVFFEAAKTAFRIAKKNYLLTFGIVPSSASSEYGYISLDSQISRPREKSIAVYRAAKFVEKPDQQEAEYLISEGYLWNSGIFAWKARVILEEIKKYLPKVYKAVNSPKLYNSLQPISIDNGVLEVSKKVRVIKADFQWRDIGSWKSLYQLLPKDSSQNILNEKVLELGCHNCLIHGAQNRVVAAIGLDNLVVVDTEDAVLVSHLEKTHEIKKLLEKMKLKNSPQYLQHPTVSRPWGSYTVIEEGDNFKVKKVLVKPKEKLSLQLHNKRSEHWVVLKGMAKVELDKSTIYLSAHQSIDIPIGIKHRLENPNKDFLEIIEVQSGQYLGEDDITRIKDKYERLAI